MFSADLIQPAQQQVEVFATFLGSLPIPRPILELLRVQVLLAALAECGVLKQLEAGIDAPER